MTGAAAALLEGAALVEADEVVAAGLLEAEPDAVGVALTDGAAAAVVGVTVNSVAALLNRDADLADPLDTDNKVSAAPLLTMNSSTRALLPAG